MSPKSIAKLNKDFGDPYRIFVERQTRKFCDDCIPLNKRVATANLMRRKDLLLGPVLNVSRNGRIDICVYRRDSGIVDRTSRRALTPFDAESLAMRRSDHSLAT